MVIDTPTNQIPRGQKLYHHHGRRSWFCYSVYVDIRRVGVQGTKRRQRRLKVGHLCLRCGFIPDNNALGMLQGDAAALPDIHTSGNWNRVAAKRLYREGLPHRIGKVPS
jgi:hypothetical protein